MMEEKPFSEQEGGSRSSGSPPKPIDQADLSSTGEVKEFPEETLCPSCGRFVGAYEKCPYCGAELKKRMSLVIWKRIAVFGTLVGLFLMWLAATRMAPKLLDVADITETYNNAIIRARGIVAGRKLYEDSGMVKLELSDKTGTISALSFSGLPKFRELGNLPKVGDQIEVLGQVQVTDQYGASLFINLPSKVVIFEAATPEKVKLSRINDSWVNTRATVEGSVKLLSYGKVAISDGANDLLLALDEDNLGKDIPKLKLGDGVRVTGIIAGSGNKLSIIPGSVDEIELSQEFALKIPRKKIGEITLEGRGEAVEIEGRVADFRTFSKGHAAVTLSDGSGSIEVILFAGTFDRVAGKDKLRLKGTRVKVLGKIDEYRGTIQIQPASADSVTVY